MVSQWLHNGFYNGKNNLKINMTGFFKLAQTHSTWVTLCFLSHNLFFLQIYLKKCFFFPLYLVSKVCPCPKPFHSHGLDVRISLLSEFTQSVYTYCSNTIYYFKHQLLPVQQVTASFSVLRKTWIIIHCHSVSHSSHGHQKCCQPAHPSIHPFPLILFRV